MLTVCYVDLCVRSSRALALAVCYTECYVDLCVSSSCALAMCYVDLSVIVTCMCGLLWGELGGPILRLRHLVV